MQQHISQDLCLYKPIYEKDIFKRLPCSMVMWPTRSTPTFVSHIGHACITIKKIMQVKPVLKTTQKQL